MTAASRLPPEGVLAPDICIVGAGVAGITLALRLRGKGLRILLLESGDHSHGAAAQDLNDGLSNDPDYPFTGSRSRGFGGTSRLWYGACIPLDPADFTPRDWLAQSGWPLAAADLAPHYRATRAIFGLPDLDHAEADLRDTAFHGDGLEAKVVAISAPTDLGRRYWPDLSRDPDILCRLDATVTALHLAPCGTRIGHLDVRSATGERLRVAAGEVILACGGIENARLLLASNAETPEGIGNRHDVVGRYHMEHPMRGVGVLPVGDRGRGLLGFVERGWAGGVDVLGTFGLSREMRDRHGLLDMHLRVYRFHPAEATAPVIAGKRAAQRLRGPDGWRHAGTMIRSALARGVPHYLAWHLAGKLSPRTPFHHVRFTAFLEQEPQAENRITLSDTRDRFGCPLPHLFWRESDFMADSHARSLALLAGIFAARGFGRLGHGKEETAFLSVYDKHGLHQMGSTRMHTDPRFGVVDRDCRVHGLQNLHIAGSSVFPTGGAANPTWTIAALANRLADTLLARPGGVARAMSPLVTGAPDV